MESLESPKNSLAQANHKFGADGESDSDEIWLISYSDLMTLLFGFFVLMYSFAVQRGGTPEKIKETLAETFGGQYQHPFEGLSKVIQGLDVKTELAKDMEVQKINDGLEITFRSSLLFASGSADLLPEAAGPINTLIKVLTDNLAGAEIYVAGHTDDIPIATAQYPSNWELSAARAATVVHEFEKAKYDRSRLVVVGYGETRPAAPNRNSEGKANAENQSKNRRVVIKILAARLGAKTHEPKGSEVTLPVPKSSTPVSEKGP